MLEKFQYANPIRRLNRVVQVILALGAALGINLVAYHNYHRADLTGGHLYSLSAETLAYLEDLRSPVHIIVTISPNSTREEERTLFRYVERLLKEYEFSARGGREGRITVEYVDIYQDLNRARTLARDFNLDAPNSLLVVAGDRQRLIPPDRILDFADGQPVAFRGEQAITSAILEVTSDNDTKIYFVSGNGEMRLDDTAPSRGLSSLAAELAARRFRVENIDLARVREIPEDAGMVVVADPQGPLRAADVEKLREYLTERAGRLLVLLSPGIDHGLDYLLEDWGILADDKLILERSDDFLESTGNLLVRRFAEHPVTQVLIDNQTFVVSGLQRPVRQDPAAPIDGRLRVTQLMFSSDLSWAESAYRSPGAPSFDPAVDLPGPVSLGAAAERRAATQLGIDVPGGKIIVFGSGDLFANRRLTTVGNFRLFFSATNWLTESDQTLAIAPRPIRQYRIVASHAELQRVGLFFLLVPASVFVLGTVVVWFRRF
ncbi:MAG: GldG family protein [Opitutales bacterium]|nr:GldG family protein [Opitutales bacterium]